MKNAFAMPGKSHQLGTTLALVFLLTACGSPSAAENNLAASQGGEAAGSAAPAQAALPIEPGIYISGYRTPEGIYFTVEDGPDAATACAGATEIFFYDGASVGDVSSDGGAHWTDNAARISRVGPARTRLDADLAHAVRGFTLAWDAAGDREGTPALALKVTGPGGFTRLAMGSLGESAYMKCGFSQLSRGMQAAVRAEQPQLARMADGQGGAAPQTTARVTPSSPIDSGFYAAGMRGGCAEAARQEYFAHWDGTHIEALGGNRYRIRFREVEEAEVVFNDRVFTVSNRTTLTDEYGARWIHCPSSQVSASARRQLGLN